MEHLADAWTAAAETWTGDWAAIWGFVVWAWRGLEFSGPIFLGGVGAICVAIHKLLKDDENLDYVRSLCRREPLATAWHRVVDGRLKAVEHFYGNARSGKAFRRSYQIALIYPLLALLLGLTFGGPLVFGAPRVDTILAQFTPASRAAVFLAVIAAISTTVAICWWGWSRNSPLWDRLNAWRNDQAARGKSTWPSSVGRAVGAVMIGGLILGITGGVSVAVGASGKAVVFATILGYGLGILITGGRINFAVWLTLGGVFSTSLMAVQGKAGGSSLALLLPTTLLLPVMNAKFDMISWYWTRRFLRNLFPASDPSGFGVRLAVDHLVRDFVLAVVFLVALAVALAAVFALWSEVLRVTGFSAGLPWRDYLQAARNDPFGGGLGVTLMLVSTLVPTFLHFAATFFALALPSIGWLWGPKTDAETLKAPLGRSALTLATLGSVMVSFGALTIAVVGTHTLLAAVDGGLGHGLARLAEGTGDLVEHLIRLAVPVAS